MYVISCRGIVAADSNGKSDPYCEIEFAGTIMQTMHREDETNPQFDEIVDFGRNKRSSSFFTLRVYDRDDFGEPDLLGTTIINFSDFEKNAPRQSKFIFGKNDLRRFVTKNYELVLPPEFVLSSTKLSSTVLIMWSHETPVEQFEGATTMTPTPPLKTLARDLPKLPPLDPLSSAAIDGVDPNNWIATLMTMQCSFRHVAVADQLGKEHLINWPNIDLSFAPLGILPDDLIQLGDLQRPSYWLVSILILAELRLRSRGVYGLDLLPIFPTKDLMFILNDGKSLEQTLENLLFYFCEEKWEKLARRKKKLTASHPATTLLALLASMPSQTFVSKDRLLRLLRRSESFDSDTLEQCFVALHGVLCMNKQGSIGLNNTTFWAILRKRFFFSSAPSSKIMLTEGMESNVTRELTDHAWHTSNSGMAATPSGFGAPPPLTLSINCSHVAGGMGVAFMKEIPIDWHKRRGSSNREEERGERRSLRLLYDFSTLH